MKSSKIKEKLTPENLIYVYIILCPILDIISFLYRNYFKTTYSPSTILRPILPCIIFIWLFFKENNKKQKVLISLIYLIYSIIHLFLFKKLHNGSSYGTLKNEIQYIVNYSLMIINLYSFYKCINNKNKITNAVYISLIIYVASLIISIITKTSSSTYLEGIGYKGYFESGNSLCTVLILSICILLANTEINWKRICLIILCGIYLVVFSGMRTGVFGFSLVIGVFILTKLFLSIIENKTISKKSIEIITFSICVFIIFIFVFGSNTIERRKMLKQNEINNIDQETNTQRYVSGDILNIYKKIQKNEIDESYMNDAEKKSIIELNDYATKIKLSNINLRAQQFLYNIFLVKNQKDISLIVFGNGYKNQIGELVMEMEVPSMLLNFGVLGFILYFGPFLYIIILSFAHGIKNLKNVNQQYIMYFIGSALAITLSCFSGYVYFNFSSMTITIIINTFLLQEIKNRDNLVNKKG